VIRNTRSVTRVTSSCGTLSMAIASWLALSLGAGAAFAQAQPGAPGTPPASNAPGSEAPAAPPPRVGQLDEQPQSSTQSEFERRLALMLAGNGLTADEASRRAVENSYAIEAKRRTLESVEASVNQAQAEFWPQLLLQARYTRLSDIGTQDVGTGAIVVTQDPAPVARPIAPGEQLFAANLAFPTLLNQYTLQAGLSIPLSDYLLRTSKAVAGAKRSRESAELDQEATRLSVAREGRVTYYEWIRALGTAIVASQAVQLSQGRYTDAQNSFNAGLASRADVLRSEASVKQAQLADEQARHAAVIAQLRLRVLMRDSGTEPFQVGENLLADLPELDRVPDAEAAYREALASRPELRVLDANKAAYEAQASVATADNYPKLQAQGNVIYANPNPRYFPQADEWKATWDVGVVLSWTPTDIPRAQAGTAVARARAAEVTAQRSALEDSLRIEVNDAIESVKEARFSLGVTETGLRAAEESYRVRRELFRAGRSTLVELTDAEAELTRARIDTVNARVNSRIALVALNYALGRDMLANGAPPARTTP
jgi:outer membrane protein TolC